MTAPAQLFTVTDADVAITTDDWYTPRWIFAAAAITFDLDVAAPVNPASRTCPALAYLTVVDDGLMQPWRGVIWMNPPYSKAAPWVDRFAHHDAGLALLPALPEVTWQGTLMAAADAVALLSVDFLRADGSTARLRWPLILAGRGELCAAAVPRVAAADKWAAGAFHVRAGP